MELLCRLFESPQAMTSSSWRRVRHHRVRVRPITKRLVERSDAKEISKRRRFDVHTLALLEIDAFGGRLRVVRT
jgi:hypothetical protein